MATSITNDGLGEVILAGACGVAVVLSWAIGIVLIFFPRHDSETYRRRLVANMPRARDDTLPPELQLQSTIESLSFATAIGTSQVEPAKEDKVKPVNEDEAKPAAPVEDSSKPYVVPLNEKKKYTNLPKFFAPRPEKCEIKESNQEKPPKEKKLSKKEDK